MTVVATVSRKAARLVRPKDVTKLIGKPAGVAVHWAGEAQRLGNHTQCVTRWREWQAFHMGAKKWSDIAYNWGVCDHGYVFVGRGWGIRSAANGTNPANDRYLAVCWMGGEGETPSAHALSAIESLIQDCRRRGAGMDVQPHRHFFNTACPGPMLSDHTGIWRNLPMPRKPSAPASAPAKAPAFPLAVGWAYGPPPARVGVATHGSGLKVWQARAGIPADGDYGPVTAAAARRIQREHALGQDGLIGPKTWAAAWDAR